MCNLEDYSLQELIDFINQKLKGTRLYNLKEDLINGNFSSNADKMLFLLEYSDVVAIIKTIEKMKSEIIYNLLK